MARRRALAHAIETAGHAAIVITISATIAATALATTFNASTVATAIRTYTLTTATIFAALTATTLNATDDAAILAAARGASVDDPPQHELLSRPRREPAIVRFFRRSTRRSLESRRLLCPLPCHGGLCRGHRSLRRRDEVLRTRSVPNRRLRTRRHRLGDSPPSCAAAVATIAAAVAVTIAIGY